MRWHEKHRQHIQVSASPSHQLRIGRGVAAVREEPSKYTAGHYGKGLPQLQGKVEDGICCLVRVHTNHLGRDAQETCWERHLREHAAMWWACTIMIAWDAVHCCGACRFDGCCLGSGHAT